MCRVFEVSRSGYYDYIKRKPGKKVVADNKIKAVLVPSFHEHWEVYGPMRMSKLLSSMGITIGRTRTRRLMKECNLVPVTRRPFIRTTESDKSQKAFPDLVQRDFTAENADEVWTSDITYIWTFDDGFVYLAVILDVFSRNLIGWAMRKDQDVALVMSAFSMAIQRRGVPKEFIFHSDKGGQYFSKILKSQLSLLHVRQSMGSTGDCYDNAVTESFNATLKKECIYREPIRNFEEAYRRVFIYIETFYNCKRLHSTLDYTNPINFENQRN
jgi:putative transposase